MIKKKALYKDILLAIRKSKARFLSIFCMIALGVFVFVGLKVTGPDMRETAEQFYNQKNLMHFTVLSSYGLDNDDQQTLKQLPDIQHVEFGYFKDLVLRDSTKSIRLFSVPAAISRYQIVSGRLPEEAEEIALDYLMKESYPLGSTVEFDAANSVKRKSFKVVGHVKSSEYTDKNDRGFSDVGTGQLQGYGVVNEEVFDSKEYQIARLTYGDMKEVSTFSEAYRSLENKHKNQLEKALENRPSDRLQTVKKEPQEKINQSKAELTKAKQTLKEQEAFLSQEQERINEQGATLTGTAKLELATVKEQLAAEKQKIEQQETLLQAKQRDLDDLELPVYTVNARRDIPGFNLYKDNTQRIDRLSNLFPIFLFGIAALVSLTTMTRFVDEERINTGTLKALGYSDRDVKAKFIIYGLVTGIAGTAAGAALGHWLLPKVIFEAYASTSIFSAVQLQFYLRYVLWALSIALACTVLSTYFALAIELKNEPAKLLLPKPPLSGSKIFLERISILWNKMSFTQKVTARNILRYKKRMIMTIFGVAGCTALLIAAFGMRDSLAGISETQFDQILKYDLIAVEKERPAIEEEGQLTQYLNRSDGAEHLPIHYEELSMTGGINQEKQTIHLIVYQSPKNLKDFVQLKDRESQKNFPLTNQVILSEKLAVLFAASVGERIQLADSDNKKHSLPIDSLAEMYMGNYIFMDAEQYEQIFKKDFTRNAHLVKVKNKSKSKIDQLSEELVQLEDTKGLQQNEKYQRLISSVLASLGNVIWILIICAILLAAVVIYNLTNINVSERLRELSTIKVLGFYDLETTLYIYRETIVLSFIGIFVGFVMGWGLHYLIIEALPPDDSMFNPDLWGSNFLLSGGITMLITLLISVIVHWRIKHVDMLEALKSVE